MKTLKELNSKWYWRLIKVFYFLFTLIITVGICAAYLDTFYSYNPKDIEQIRTEVNSYYERYRQLGEKIESMHGEYTKENIVKLAVDGKIKPAIFYYIFSKEKNPEIEGVSEVCVASSKENCHIDSIDEYSYNDYIKNGKMVLIPDDDILTFKRISNELTGLYEAMKNFDKNKDNGYELVSGYNKFFTKELPEFSSYQGFFDYLKITFASIGTIVGMILISLIIKHVLFYVIFGKVLPPKQ